MPVATLQLTEQQVVDLVRQLSPAQRLSVLRAIIPEINNLDFLQEYGDRRIREVCAARGIDWDALDEGQRQTLIDDLLHQA